MRGYTGIAVICIVIWGALLITASSLHYGLPAGDAASHYIERSGEETGSSNMVTAIIVDYRLYDTIGEITVLFTAILGVTLILGRNHHRIERKIKQMDHLYGGSTDGDVYNR
jgi:multisubunit Na+/H+ antiporter MnhB subunit